MILGIFVYMSVMCLDSGGDAVGWGGGMGGGEWELFNDNVLVMGLLLRWWGVGDGGGEWECLNNNVLVMGLL